VGEHVAVNWSENVAVVVLLEIEVYDCVHESDHDDVSKGDDVKVIVCG
jgi:hypothetical protein